MKSIYKILLVTDHHELKLGGAEKYFFTLKSALEKQANIEVFSLGFGPEEKIDNNTIILKETSNSFLQRYWWRLFFNPYKYYQLRSVLKRIKPDVVHLHNVKKYTISVMKAVQEYPVVRTVHDFGNMCPTGWNLHEDLQPCATGISVQCGWRHKRNLNPLVFLGRVLGLLRFNALQKKVVKKYIAPSPQLAAYLEKNNFKPTYHLPPFRANDLPVTFANLEMRHFLYVGQLMPHKGVGKLIDEFALACRSNAKLVLKIVGKGDCEAELKAKVKLLGLEENIFFLGWQNPDEFYPQAMAVIFSSIGLEAFGLVITETMRHGRPVIGTHRGPTAWLVEDGETGLLYDPLKLGDLAEKILVLAENKELVERYGRNAAEKFAGMMDNEEIIARQVAIYRELAD